MFAVAGPQENSLKQHRSIYEAIRTGDPDAARDTMATHLQTVEGGIDRYLKAHGEPGIKLNSPRT
jgi:DNA-binding FadR family transcriptional regulator